MKAIYYKLFILTFALLFTLNYQGFCQLKDYGYQNGILTISTETESLAFKVLTENIISFQWVSNHEPSIETNAVSLSPSSEIGVFKENQDSLSLYTQHLLVSIHKNPFKISFYQGKTLQTSIKQTLTTTDSTQLVSFEISKNEAFYGSGERAMDFNKYGKRLELYNQPHYGYETDAPVLNFNIPIITSSKGYGWFFDNPSKAYIDIGKSSPNELMFEATHNNTTFYFFASPTKSQKELSQQITLLTGKQPLLPRWAYGSFASRMGYHSQEEVLKTAALYQKKNIPLDAIVLDLFWFGKEIQGTMGNLDWHTDSFPNPEQMIQELKNQGVKTVIITEPFVLTNTKNWSIGNDRGLFTKDSIGKTYTFDFYFGNSSLIDIFNPKAGNWLWSYYHRLKKQGVAGWWGDLGEPEFHPADQYHANGKADAVHNIYGHFWAKTIADKYHKLYPGERLFNLMRAGYAGSQKYGMVPWSGDVNRSWGGLKPQTQIALSMQLTGMAYAHSDLGGFAGEYQDDELYIRWLQYGVFQPIFRPHGQESVPAEPVFYNGNTLDIVRKQVQLRYQLMPYTYSIAFENSQEGTPLMRPIIFEPSETNNHTLFNYTDTYLWGNNFLISPVTEKSINSQEVYFPANANWVDFFSDEIFNGGQFKTIQLTLDHIPVFVRQGAIIPMVETYKNDLEYSTKELTLHYYRPSKPQKTSFKLYDDDGNTKNAYQNNQYETIEIIASNESNSFEIELEKSNTTFQDAPKSREITIIIHHTEKGNIYLNDSLLKKTNKKYKLLTNTNYWYDKVKQQMILKVKWQGKEPILISLK